jgi:lantibiotic modifying enzyme
MIEILKAEKSLVGLITLGEESAQKILASTPTYWCQSCDDITAFRLDSHKPHLPEKIEQEFNQVMGEINKYEKGYSNFCCRHCGQKIRCVYEINEFAMSSYHYYPILIMLYND